MNIISRIANGKLLIPESLAAAANDLAKNIHNANKTVMFSVRVIRDKRTLLQNNYYWSLMDIISRETGYTPGEAHAYCKAQFIKLVPGVQTESISIFDIMADVMMIDGEPGELTTTRLNTKQFMEYIEQIRTFFREKMEICLPTPDTWELLVS